MLMKKKADYLQWANEAVRRKMTNSMKSVRPKRRKEMRFADFSAKKTKGIVEESKLDSTRPRMKETQIEISPKRLLWDRLSRPRATSCLIKDSLTRQVALVPASEMKKSIIYMISHYLLTEQQPASTRTSTARPVKVV